MSVILTSEASVTLAALGRRLGYLFSGKRYACVSTAAAVYPKREWVATEQEYLRRLGAEVFEVELSDLTKDKALRVFDDSDGIFVHGGNTFYLLQEMQRVGFKEFVRGYLANGRSYVGSSAGSIVAGPRIDVIAATDDPSKGPSVDPCDGLHLVEVIPMVHFDDGSYLPAFRESFARALEVGANILPLRNDQFIISESGRFELVTAI